VPGNIETVLIGYSGHGYVVADTAIASGNLLKFYIDRNKVDANPFGLIYLGHEEEENFAGFGRGYGFVMGIGDNATREKIANKLLEKEEILLSITHPAASISGRAEIGTGVFISRGAMVNAMAEVGAHSILNTGCIVEHGCKLGSAVHIAPGAVLAGDVGIGDRSFIGANAVVKQGVKIGKDVIVGAGSVVINDIPERGVYAGNPAKKINGKS
jgi:sugar O-acyltransferase (sialic acid O-acetyltransferase NeuD family)